MKRPIVAVTVLAAAALLLSGCAAGGAATPSSSATTNTGPIKFAVVYGFTGITAPYGKDFKAGFNAAVDEVNASGGAGGRKIEVKFLDSQSDPTHAVTVLTQAVDSGYKPDVVMAGALSSEALAVLPYTSNLPVFSDSIAESPDTNNPSKFPYQFGISSPQNEALNVIGETMKAKGQKTLSVLTSSDATGDGILAAIQGVTKKYGIKIVDVERPAAGALNFDVEYSRMISAKPSAVFFDLDDLDAMSRVFTSRQTIGATKTPLYGGSAVAATIPAKLASKAALANCSLPADTFTVKQATEPKYLVPLINAFKSGGSIYTGALGFDVAKLAAIALDRTHGNANPKAMTAALTGTAIPAETMALYTSGTSYSPTDHFPTLKAGSTELVPCASTQSGGLWIPAK
jgi:branched-chain amino acid transport system substrate-binding protein